MLEYAPARVLDAIELNRRRACAPRQEIKRVVPGPPGPRGRERRRDQNRRSREPGSFASQGRHSRTLPLPPPLVRLRLPTATIAADSGYAIARKSPCAVSNASAPLPASRA